MSFVKIVRGLNFRQLTSLLGWFLRHPLYMIATVSATITTFRISQKNFPDIHGKHNKANAFRHALWNILIAKKCSKFSKNLDSVLKWTEQITNWHEEFSPNEELAKAMDLHNNQIGRDLYPKVAEMNLNGIAAFMIGQLKEALLIKDSSEIKKSLHQLVYLED